MVTVAPILPLGVSQLTTLQSLVSQVGKLSRVRAMGQLPECRAFFGWLRSYLEDLTLVWACGSEPIFGTYVLALIDKNPHATSSQSMTTEKKCEGE